MKHSALTPTGKDTPWTQQANSRDKPAFHPAAAARSMPLPLIPTFLELSFTMGEQVPATRASSMPALLPARAATATAFHGLQERRDSQQSPLHSSLCCSCRLVLKDSPYFRMVERQVSFLSSGHTEGSVPHPQSREMG